MNLSCAACVLTRTWKKEPAKKDEVAAEKVPASLAMSTEYAISEKHVSIDSLPVPAKARSPIPEHEQLEIFKWMLEEKRKVKPRNYAAKTIRLTRRKLF